MRIFKITTVKDDNELVRSNENSLAKKGMSQAEAEETMRIIARLDRLANLVAEEFHFEKEDVMRDFFKDLQLLKNPELINQLNMNSTADMLSKQIIEEWQENPEEFNLVRNSAIDYIMKMSDEKALNILRQTLPQLQTPQRGYYIGRNNQRRIR